MNAIRIDPTIEAARRETIRARNAAYAAKNGPEVQRLTAVLATFPVKTSNGTYQNEIVCACDSVGWDGVHYACPLAPKGAK